jgi:hypothetical protein
MDKMNNQYFTFINNTIRGTYNIEEDTQQKINDLIEDINILERHIDNIEYTNSYLLKDIKFLDKIYNYDNITHNNTINFIMKNSRNIKFMLDKIINAYEKNIYKIELLKERIIYMNKTIYIYNSKLNMC